MDGSWGIREGYRCVFGDRGGARRPSGGSHGGGTTRDEIPPSYYACQQQQQQQHQQQQANNDSSDALQLPRLGPFSISVLLLSLAFISKADKLLFTESKNESSPPKTSRLTTSKVSITTIAIGIGMTLLLTSHTALAVGSGDSSNVGSTLIAVGMVGALAGQMYSSSKSPSMKKVQRRPFEDITNNNLGVAQEESDGVAIETSNHPGVVILGITIKHDDDLSDVLTSFRKKYSSDKLA